MSTSRRLTPIRAGDPHALPKADVVVATPYYGWPTVSGGWQRLLHTVRGIARTRRVVVVSQQAGPADEDEVQGFVRDSGSLDMVLTGNEDRRDMVESELFSRWGPVTELARDLIRTPLPLHARQWCSPTFRDALAAARATTGAAVAWAFDPTIAEDARAAGFPTIVVDVDDIPSEAERVELDRMRHAKRLPVLKAHYWRTRRWERSLPRRYASVVLAKDSDRRFFAPRDQGRIDVLPNGVLVPARPAVERDDAATMLFVGSLDYEPNDRALRYFVGDVLPRVWVHRPDVRFQVVGRGRSEWLRARAAADPRIAVAERAPVLEPYYDEAAVVVAPILDGGGTRIKVLEALAWGKALVSTTFAAAGCGFVDGEHLRYADHADAFAAECVSLLGDPPARRRLGAAGRAYVSARYDWDAIEAAVPAIVGNALAAT